MFRQVITADTPEQLKSKIIDMANMLMGITCVAGSEPLYRDPIPVSSTADDVEDPEEPEATAFEDFPSLDEVKAPQPDPDDIEDIEEETPGERAIRLAEEAEITKQLKRAAAKAALQVTLPSPVPAVAPYAPAVVAAKPIESNTELDAAGMPWDERIHSATKAKTAKNLWRIRRGADESLVAAIESQYQQQRNHVNPPVAAPPVQAMSPLHQMGVPVVQVSAPQVTAGPVQAAPVAVEPAPVIPTAVDFRPQAHDFNSFKSNFTTVMAALIGAGKVNRKYILELNQYFEIPDIWDIVKDDTKLNEMFGHFAAAGLITRI